MASACQLGARSTRLAPSCSIGSSSRDLWYLVSVGKARHSFPLVVAPCPSRTLLSKRPRWSLMATSSSLAVTSSTSTGSSAMPALMTRSTEVLYRFLVPEYVTQFGEYLKVVGSLPQLGSWDLGAAPAMTWQPGHKWLFEVRLPRTTYEFKVVAMQGSGVRWEQGINRVVQADQGEMDVPVELVINLHCEFGLTTATGMELVLNRKSVQETYELAAATLELLQKRRERLEQQLKKAGKSRKLSTEQQAEAARLDAALTAQQRSLSDLSNLVSTAKLSEDGEALLLTMEGGKVQLPDPIGLLSNAQAASVTMALGEAPLPEVLPQLEDGAHTSTDEGPAATNGAPAAAADAASSNGNGYVAAQQQQQQQQEAEQGSVEGARPAEAASRSGDGWGTEDMGNPAVEAYLQGDASALSSPESDYELEPDDAAAAMAAAAFANLPSSKQSRNRRASSSSSGAKQSKNGAVGGAAAPAPAPASAAPAPAATAAAALAAAALSAAEVLSGEAAAPEATHAAPAEAAPDAEDAEATPAAVAEAVAAAADAVAAAEQPQNAVNTLAAAAQAVAAAEEAGEAAEALAADNNMEAALEAQTAAEVAAYAAAVAAATAAEAAGVIVEIPAPPAAVAAAAPAQQAPAAEPAPPAEAFVAAAPATEAAAAVSPTAVSEPEPEPAPSPAPSTPVIDPTAPLGMRSGPGTTAAAVAAAKEALAAAIAAAAAANATVAAALEEESERGTKRASALAHLLGDVDLEKLPAPKPVAGGALLFSADMLASVQLVKDPNPPKPRRRGTPRPRVEAVP